MIWVALVWLALIALWGTSETWDLGDLARRLGHALRGLHDSRSVSAAGEVTDAAARRPARW